MSALYEERSIVGRGRGLVATANIPSGNLMYVALPDISVLYSSSARTHCARCFRVVPHTAASGSDPAGRSGSCSGLPESVSRSASAGDGVTARPDEPYVCATCDQFVLCASCVAQLTAETAARALQHHPRLRTHALACQWFNELPASVRAVGADTDMLRFCLEYGARDFFSRQPGHAGGGDDGPRTTAAALSPEDAATATDGRLLVEHLRGLDTAESAQSAEVLRFCEVFAREKIVRTFGPSAARDADPRGAAAAAAAAAVPTPRYPVDAEQLRLVLLRVHVNSLGFPFSDTETLGWTLDRTVCMLNHSCLPNAAVVHVASPTDRTAATGGGAYIGIQSIRAIKTGEEISLSYVDLPSLGDDVQARARALLDRYRFLCRCARCEAQRAIRQRSGAHPVKK